MSYTKAQMKDSVKRCNEYIIKNKKLPNYVVVGQDKVDIKNYIKLPEMKDGLNRINIYIEKNNKYPNYVTILDIQIKTAQYKLLFGGKVYKVATKKTDFGDYDGVTKYFKKVFGSYSSFDDALSKVKDRGYNHYYNPVYTNKSTIDRIKSGKGVNCSDSSELFWHIGKSLGYKVDYLHVRCKSGEGHVRLRIQKGNKTYYRDPAAVLSKNGKPVSYNWCSENYTLLAVNPSWIGKQA